MHRLVCSLVLLAFAAAPVLATDKWNLPVGSFTLTKQNGEPFTPESLRGKVWVAHFFYPSCQGPCTKTVPAMMKLQEALAGKPDYVLVSIALTSEPPELLAHFAKDHHADPKQWIFLTGLDDYAQEVVQKCFFQTARRKENPKPGDEIDHTVSLVMIDRNGLMQGAVSGTDPDAVPELVARLRELAGERYLLPAVNAGLNGLCTVLLVSGWIAICRRREQLHKVCMLAALLSSMAFLTCYLYFHFAVLDGKPTGFRGTGIIRPIYYGILLSHTVLAALVAPLALIVTYQGLRDRRVRHVRLAKWTLPIWLYVSITGVIVYVLLYQVYPPY